MVHILSSLQWNLCADACCASVSPLLGWVLIICMDDCQKGKQQKWWHIKYFSQLRVIAEAVHQSQKPGARCQRWWFAPTVNNHTAQNKQRRRAQEDINNIFRRSEWLFQWSTSAPYKIHCGCCLWGCCDICGHFHKPKNPQTGCTCAWWYRHVSHKKCEGAVWFGFIKMRSVGQRWQPISLGKSDS